MKKIKITMILMLGLLWLTAPSFAVSDEYEPEYYDNAKVVRVKLAQGEAYITRSFDEGREEASENLPIFEKDMAGTTDGRLEIYLGRLNYLRLDQDSEVVFDQVPELRKTKLTLRVLRGGVFLDIESIDYQKDIEIQTPDCGIFVLDKGSYRINVTENGKTEVFVLNGIAEIAGENYSKNLGKNQKIVMFNGQVKERPFYFYASDYDDFDQWNLERRGSEGYANFTANRYLDQGYEDYEYEMSRNGSWRYESTYNCYVWSPYAMTDDWRPYSNGRWVWTPYYGYVWTSYDTCGYFTHHYGRWHWDPISRWCWVPGYHWSPAWVSWFWDDDYYGWCPISYWNRPIIIVNNRWHRNYDHHRGIPIHGRSTTIIRKSQLSASHIGHASLKGNDMTAISKKSLVFKGNAPGDKLVLSKINVIDAKGKSVIYKKEALLSSNKYKVVEGNGIKQTGVEKDRVYQYNGSKISKDRIAKYSPTTEGGSTPLKTRAYKYKAEPAPDSRATTSDAGRVPSKYKPYKSGDHSDSSANSGSSSSGSGIKYTPRSSTPDRSPIKSSAGKSSSSSSGDKSAVKKKKDDSYPSYSSYGNDYNTDNSTNTDTPTESPRSYQPRTFKYYAPASPSSPAVPTYKERRSTNSDNTPSYSSPYKSSTPSYKERSSSSYSAPAYTPSRSVKPSSPSTYSMPSNGGHSSIKSSAVKSSGNHSSSNGSSHPIKKKD